MIFKDGKLDVQRYFDPMMEPAMDGDLEKTVSEIGRASCRERV